MLKIITTGRLGRAFYSAIKDLKAEFEITFTENPSPGDVARADCLAAFSAPDNVDLSKIKWIHSFGAGVEGFLRRNDIDEDTIITRTVGRLGFKMGEFCLCHMLNFYQHTFKVYENNKLKKWESIHPSSVADRTVLILGTGEMAKGISSVLAPLRVKCIGVNTSGNKTTDVFSATMKFNNLKTIASKVSCIINTLPLTPDTVDLLDMDFFHLFNNTLFINVGRGQSVVTADLLHAIDDSKIVRAVLDVFENEPLPEESPLWDHPDIFISPHQSAVTDIDDVMESFLEAHKLIQANERNHLFVDLKRKY